MSIITSYEGIPQSLDLQQIVKYYKHILQLYWIHVYIGQGLGERIFRVGNLL